MDIVVIGKLAAVFLLVIGNAFFVGSEIAITSARRSRIKQLADLGNKSAATVQLLQNEPNRFYSVTQIGITLVSMALGAIGIVTIADVSKPFFEMALGFMASGEELTTLVGTAATVWGFVVVSFLHVVAGELAPKILAFHKAEQMSMALGGIVNFLYLIWRPLIFLMEKSSNGLLRICGQGDIVGGGDGHGHSSSMSAEELTSVIIASEQSGHIPQSTGRILRGAFKLTDDNVRRIMVPRSEVTAFHKDQTFSEALDVFKSTNHKRFPVHDGNMENIVGVVTIKTMLHGLNSTPEDLAKTLATPVSAIMTKPFMVPATAAVPELLEEFKKQRRQIAIAVNEYGGMAGVVTLDDVLSDLVGEYQDEYAPTSRRVNETAKGQFDIDANIRVSDLEPLTNFPFPLSPEYNTLGGLVYTSLGRIPKVGDSIDLKAARLEVAEMTGHRIDMVKFVDTMINESGEEVAIADIPEAEAE